MPNPLGKTGAGPQASAEQEYLNRRERLRELALQSIDLEKDPYFMKNHIGTYECKLCLTLHPNEANYLVHTQGRKHQTNLARRAAREEAMKDPQPAVPRSTTVLKRHRVKIGRPGYKVTKQKNPQSGQQSLLFEIDYPEIEDGLQPRHRFMSSFEQKIETPDRRFQYLLFAAEPYETIGFKIPNQEVDQGQEKFMTDWNRDKLKFTLLLHFKEKKDKESVPLSTIGTDSSMALPVGIPVAGQNNVSGQRTYNPMMPKAVPEKKFRGIDYRA